jgi:hypothetical protein
MDSVGVVVVFLFTGCFLTFEFGDKVSKELVIIT